ncbi:efflux RND transporter periplasmic adaptor subunit, partial [Chloroflexota bacterium]
GNIEVSKDTELAFGSGGRVDKIYVEEGDEVSKGDILAKLETDDLELAVTQAEVTVAQGEVDLQTAKNNLEKAKDLYILEDIKLAKADVDEAEKYLENALDKIDEYLPVDEHGDYPDLLEWILEGDFPQQKELIHAWSRLNAAKDTLDAMLSGSDPYEVALSKQQIAAAEQSLEHARQSVELTRQSLKLAQLSPELARQSLERAQKQLDEATVIAPFNGIIASVYVDEGDVIPPPTMVSTMIFHLVDLTSLELKVEVDEIDMPEVKLGQRVTIEVDALPDFPLEGEVTLISPIAKEEGGVVIYEVKVSFNVPEGSGIRYGMSADANVVITERSNVLLVPDRAIGEDSEGNPVVTVMVGEQTEERMVVIGLSDGFDTEIVSGLSGGEVVVVGKRAK